MINYETFAIALETYLTSLGYRKDEYIYTIYFMLGTFEMFCIERRKDNLNIWYRNDMMGFMNKVDFDKNFETTQDEMNKVKEAAVRVLGQYKNFLVASKITELEKDFQDG